MSFNRPLGLIRVALRILLLFLGVPLRFEKGVYVFSTAYYKSESLYGVSIEQ